MGDARGETPAAVVWIEGLPGSGKTTLAQRLRGELQKVGVDAEMLDGDEVRRDLSPDLGYDRKDREVHARRVSYVARLLARNGVTPLVAMITPYETSRQRVRAVFGDRFTEIWLKCPLSICEQRDPKGIYRLQQSVRAAKVTGLDDPFEEPLDPDLTIDTSRMDVTTTTAAALGHLRQRHLIPAPIAARPA